MVKIDKKFNINKYFQSYVPNLREVFLEYYDNEYADIINNAFSNFSFIGYLPPVTISNLIFDLGNEISSKLEDAFILETGFNDIPNFKMNAFFFGFNKKDNCTFYKILQRTENYESDAYWIFGIDSKSDESKEKLEQILKRVDVTRDTFFKYQELYYEQIKPYQEYFDIGNRLEKLEKDSTPDYIIYFIKKLFQILPKEDKEFYLANQEKFESEETASEYFRKMKCFENYVSYCHDNINFDHPGLISFFSEEKEAEINNPKESNYIMRHRIKYFQNLGIDLGDNYEDYLNNPEVKRLWPTQDMIKKIEKVKEKIYEETIKSFFLTIPMYQENKKVLEETGFTDTREAPFQFKYYLKSHWNISPNYVMKPNFTKIEEGFILHPIILFAANSSNDEFDKSLIHELNHLVEEHIKYIVKKITETGFLQVQVTTECGFNCKGDEEYITELERHKYELFNETINDIIADEIVEFMHAKGIYLFTEPDIEDTKYEGVCLYSYSKPLALDFFNEFRNDIIHARMTGDRSSLYEKVGENNFVDLNNLINEFYIYFGIIKNDGRLKETLENIEEKCITDDTKAYQYFINRSNEILENMKINYSKNIYKRKL